MAKNLKHFNKTWYVASRTTSHHIICSNHYPRLTFIYFINLVFYIKEKVIRMDSLEIIIAFDLEFDEQMKVYEVPLTFAEHHADILGQDTRRAFTGPLVLRS